MLIWVNRGTIRQLFSHGRSRGRDIPVVWSEKGGEERARGERSMLATRPACRAANFPRELLVVVVVVVV